MRKYSLVFFCALILIMVSSAESWAKTKPSRKIPAERAEFLDKSYVRTWSGVTENGGFDPYAVNPNPQAPSSREELEAEKREAMKERERLHAEWAISKTPASPPQEENYSRSERGEVESRDLLKVGETDTILTSWYGPGFQGNTTASGEEFDMDEISAAHKDWPLGTRVLLRNMGNGLTVIVIINDRGPYYEERGLDLSRAAAEALGMVDEGVVWLEYTIIEIPAS